ncbi:MAG: cytochrome o ubiquinol oxidase subunit II [Candidatus Tokpelaia sp. JSC188]|nr:MAG: cytochrome o ubiquinol oxidase subunit II [Candidatus Tokpelaia sp. JSC188]
MENLKKVLGILSVLTLMSLLSGCDVAVLSPTGLVAKAQRDLIIISLILMLCIVIPIMFAVIFFAIKYHASKKDTEYLPDWGISHKVEFFMWSIPICVVSILAMLSAYFTYKYEPSKPLDYAVATDNNPLRINAVALEWKWLFIYPEYGIATINEIYAPTGRQVALQLTAQDTINAFWVPKLGSVLYAMPQMNAKLHLLSEENGRFPGMSANYSGDGFAGMHFTWHSVSNGDFDNWVSRVRRSGNQLNYVTYLELTKKSKSNPVTYFSGVDRDLYYRVVNRCVAEGSKCNEELMRLAAARSLWGELCSVFDVRESIAPVNIRE